MHSTLAELLENLKPGLLWVSREGVVRYANGNAQSRTGLAPGGKLYDPEMVRAVAASVAGKAPRTVMAMGRPEQPGEAVPELNCRVLPGLSVDDAFVMIGPDPGTDHAAAFDNLMQVIRSDLRDPLAQANTALQVARGGGDPGDAVHAMDALCASVDEVLYTLNKLVDLADVWSSSALLATDRIELWPLLQSVWQEIEPLALDHSVKVRFKAQGAADKLATLYGSELWLKRVFLECLEAAVRASRRGAVLDIEHRQMGPRALIVFRDCGVFARPAPDAVELTPSSPNAKRRPTPIPARDHIGLKLCQHIVSLHGGCLREEEEDGLRNFLIDLPTGAPHRSDESHLDIAQAQQYAQDLALLMARARKNGKASSTQ